jgi:hypothetical protein
MYRETEIESCVAASDTVTGATASHAASQSLVALNHKMEEDKLAAVSIQAFNESPILRLSKFSFHKGFTMTYYTCGGSRRLLLKMRPQNSDDVHYSRT